MERYEPSIESRVALDRWLKAIETLADGKTEIRDASPASMRRSRVICGSRAESPKTVRVSLLPRITHHRPS